MKALYAILKVAPGLLALLLAAPLVSSAGEAAPKERKPSKATLEKYDADKDGELSEEEKARAKEGAREKAKLTHEENLAKYDANKDGKLDQEERARKQADEEAAKAARKTEREARKAAKETEKK